MLNSFQHLTDYCKTGMRYLCVLIFFSLVPHAFAFTDIPSDHPEALTIQLLQQQGVISGYSDNTFRPDALVNRAESLKLILSSGVTLPTTSGTSAMTFTDIHSSDWFFPYVQQAYDGQLVQGVSKTLFIPARPVSRAEFLKILFKAYGFSLKMPTSDLYKDVSRKAWFSPYLYHAVDLGLLQPDASHRLYPEQSVSRAEAAHFLYLILLLQHGNDSDFLLSHVDQQIAQIEIYMVSSKLFLAQTTAVRATDLLNQVLRRRPQDTHSQALLQIVKGYQLLIKTITVFNDGKVSEAHELAQQAIDTATRAWQLDHDLQPLARHLKDRANDLIQALK